MTGETEAKRLATEIWKHVTETKIGSGYWWYDGGRVGDLPEALAADLVAAGWRAPIPPPEARQPEECPWCVEASEA